MKVALNYADYRFRKLQKINSKTAKVFGGFDKVLEYGPEDLSQDFKSKYKAILEQKRGGGYWLWKSYIILDALDECEYGDYLFYCDSGAVFINKIDFLIDAINCSGEDIMLYESPLIEFQWTNRNLLEKLGCDKECYKLSNQMIGGYILIKKSNSSMDFFREFFELCKESSYITDEKTLIEEEAFDHRHDQSILSLLAKKRGVVPHRDPSDYGIFPKKYFEKGRLFRVNKYRDSYPVIILSNRSASPYLYAAKYYMRSCLNKSLTALGVKL